MSVIRRSLLALGTAVVLMVAGFVSSASAGAESETVTGTFDMLTYNVAGLPEGISSSNPSVNMPLISPLLNAYDLVLSQEDFANPDPPLDGIRVYHDDLVSQVDFPYLSTPQVPPMGTNAAHPDALLGDGLNFLSRFPFGTVDRVTWDDCMGVLDHSSDCLATKGFAVTTIEFAPGVIVDVYDLHADAGGAAEDQAARASNFRQLAAYIDAHSAGHAVIMGGDTNLHTDRPEAAAVWSEFLTATGLTDVCQAVDCGADVDVIDKIAFRSNDSVELTPQSHTFERERFTRDDGQPLSDHDPLAVQFAYRARVTTPTVPDTSTPASSTPETPTTPSTVPGSSTPATSVVPGSTVPGSTAAPGSSVPGSTTPAENTPGATAPAARAVAASPAYTG